MSKLQQCSAGDRRVTRQMTATMRESRNPLRIPEMLENVLDFLSVKDLKSCRLVNKFWNDTALKPMQKKGGTIRFPGNPFLIPNHRDRGLEDMEKFLQCFSVDRGPGLLSEIRSDIPCTKFEIHTSVIKSSDREKLIVAKFLKTISACVTEIVILNEEKDFGHLNGMGMEELKFPSLKHTTFRRFRHHAFSPWMSIFITNAPQLEKLSVKWMPCLAIPRDPSLTPLFQVLKHNQCLKIKDLEIYNTIENNDLINLSESNLKLKSLTLFYYNFPREPIVSLPQLLKSQSESLETFTIKDLYESVAADVPFPIMKNLNSLTMYGGCLGFIDYAAQMPSLEKVVFDRMTNESGWSKNLNGEMKPAQGVKELYLGCSRESRPNAQIAQAIREAVRIFPNITKLQLAVYIDCIGHIPIVYDSLPNLEELTLDISRGLENIDSIDGLFTGLSEEGCQDALRRLRDWTRNFDDSSVQIGINHSPISVLKNLKWLRLRNPWSRDFEVTQVSLCLALMKMPSLQILDLCERSKAPDELIPKTVLKEFRKNRLILWKPMTEY